MSDTVSDFNLVAFRLDGETLLKLEQLVTVTGLNRSEVLRRLIVEGSAQAPQVHTDLGRIMRRKTRLAEAKKRRALEDAMDDVERVVSEFVR